MNYPCFFREGFTPQSGIDTITIWLHPEIINCPQKFHKDGNNNHPISLRYEQEINQNTGIIFRTNFFVDIQAEAIDPNNNIFGQVLSLLNYLTDEGILHRPIRRDTYNIMNFFQVNFDRLFALDRLDFYFDLQKEDMYLIGNPYPSCPNTHYSSRKNSVLKAYFRDERLKQKRHISYDELDCMDYQARIEFSLCRENCNYLHIQNINGSYENVFLRYLPFLARKWLDHRSKVVNISKRNIQHYAHHLNQIIAVAGQRIPQYRDLLETPLKPIPYKSARRNETDLNFIAEFYGRS